MEELAKQAPPGCGGLTMFPEFMGGMSGDADARGAFCGIRLDMGRELSLIHI